VTGVFDFSISAPFRAEPLSIGASCIFIVFVFVFWVLIFLVGVSSLIVVFGSLPPVMGNQQVIDNKVSYFAAQPVAGGEVEAEMLAGGFQFDGKISPQVLENYPSRSICIEGMLNGRGPLADDIRMLKKRFAAGVDVC